MYILFYSPMPLPVLCLLPGKPFFTSLPSKASSMSRAFSSFPVSVGSIPSSISRPTSSRGDREFLWLCQKKGKNSCHQPLGLRSYLPRASWLICPQNILICPSSLQWLQQKPTAQNPGQPETKAHPDPRAFSLPLHLQSCLPGLRI